MIRNLASSLTALALIASFGAAAHAATFTDSTFVTGNWNDDVRAYFNERQPTLASTQGTSDGNPGDYRRMEVVIPSPDGYIHSFHALSGATWNPSTQGEIASLAFSFDMRTFEGGSFQYALGLRQGNTVYRTAYVGGIPNTWTNQADAFVEASDFENFITGISGTTGTYEFGGGSGPDFSASGGAIQFGFIFNTGGGPETRVGGVDNYSLTVIPEPASLALMGLGGLLMVARRRK